MATGRVKWFDDAQGSGIITPDGGGDELLAHFRSIKGDGDETLRAGQKVEFQVAHGPTGLHADLITPLLGD